MAGTALEEREKLQNSIGLTLSESVVNDLIRDNLQMLQESFLLNTFSNTDGVESDLRRKAELLSVPAADPYFVVCTVSVQSRSENLAQDMLRILLRDSIRRSIEALDWGVCFCVDNNGLVNCLVNAPWPEPRRHLEMAMVDARESLSSVADVHLFYAIGPTVESLSRLYLSRAGALSMLVQVKANAVPNERNLETIFPGKNANSIQEQLLRLLRENDAYAVNKALNAQLSLLREDQRTGQLLAENFLYSYLKIISGECMRLGVAMERFENYLPAVVSLLQSDIPGCVESLTKLTEQILRHASVQRTNETNHLLTMAKDYIRDHIADEKLNLEAVSNYVGLSRVYFCKLFHQMEGVSFNVYLKRIRIEKAKQLLMTTNMKVFEVSSAVGFSHAKYFGQVFKSEVGQTPVEYQKFIDKQK